MTRITVLGEASCLDWARRWERRHLACAGLHVINISGPVLRLRLDFGDKVEEHVVGVMRLSY